MSFSEEECDERAPTTPQPGSPGFPRSPGCCLDGNPLSSSQMTQCLEGGGLAGAQGPSSSCREARQLLGSPEAPAYVWTPPPLVLGATQSRGPVLMFGGWGPVLGCEVGDHLRPPKPAWPLPRLYEWGQAGPAVLSQAWLQLQAVPRCAGQSLLWAGPGPPSATGGLGSPKPWPGLASSDLFGQGTYLSSVLLLQLVGAFS